jgi:hypothetical protein
VQRSDKEFKKLEDNVNEQIEKNTESKIGKVKEGKLDQIIKLLEERGNG